MPNRTWPALVLGALMLAASPSLDARADDRVVNVPTGDPEMEAAMAKARASLNDFWTHQAAPGKGEERFSLKVAISDAGKTEHFWLGDVRKEGTGYTGQINNTPQTVRNVRAGQRYSFSAAQISDWMFFRNGKIVGNETMRPLLKRLPPEQAKQYRAMLETP